MRGIRGVLRRGDVKSDGDTSTNTKNMYILIYKSNYGRDLVSTHETHRNTIFNSC